MARSIHEGISRSPGAIGWHKTSHYEISLALEHSGGGGGDGGLDFGSGGREEIAGHRVLERARRGPEVDCPRQSGGILQVSRKETGRKGVAAAEPIDDLNIAPLGYRQQTGWAKRHALQFQAAAPFHALAGDRDRRDAKSLDGRAQDILTRTLDPEKCAERPPGREEDVDLRHDRHKGFARLRLAPQLGTIVQLE